MDSTDGLKDELRRSLGPCLASDLAAHIRREGALFVAPGLDLLEAAIAIATDDAAAVRGWLEQAKLRRPTEAEAASWSAQPELEFMAVVVQPYVLFQERS